MQEQHAATTAGAEATAPAERLVKFIEAAKSLAAEGLKVTYSAVFERAGNRGSMTDVATAIKLWRSQQAEAARPALVRHELPESETQAVMSLMAQLWAKAEAEAQALIERERQALEEVRAEVEDEKAQALAAADASLKERDAALEHVTQLEAEVERVREEGQERARREVEQMREALATERANAAAANARAEERERLIRALESQIETLKKAT